MVNAPRGLTQSCGLALKIQGVSSSNLVYDTRSMLKSLLGCDKRHELIFTSGCTEACNLAIFGYLLNFKNQHIDVIYTSNEHNSVARPLYCLKSQSESRALRSVQTFVSRANKEVYVIFGNVDGYVSERLSGVDQKSQRQIIFFADNGRSLV